jgi:hypothetical protein
MIKSKKPFPTHNTSHRRKPPQSPDDGARAPAPAPAIDETTPFWTKRAFHLKGKGSKILSKSKSVFNLKFVQSSPKLQF